VFLEGQETKDPAFNLDAVWINDSQKERAHTFGYTVVDASTVVATHLSQILEKNSHQLLGYEETQQLLDKLAHTSPKLVKELVPDALSIGAVNKVLQGLLIEHIPLTDTRTIGRNFGGVCVPKSKDTDFSHQQCPCGFIAFNNTKNKRLKRRITDYYLKTRVGTVIAKTQFRTTSVMGSALNREWPIKYSIR
jgi:flagellar biosynthesis protein FlhA